jgi:DNA primase catalytic core
MGGFIKKEFIEKLLDIAIIEEVIGDYIELKKSGSVYVGKSPQTNERTASFTVSPVKRIWKDFSSGEGGNIISFFMNYEGMTYPEAIEAIASKYNTPVEYEYLSEEVEKKRKQKIEKKESLRSVLKAAHKNYVERYKNLPEDHPARLEVESKRKYSNDVIVEWGIGYAPEDFLYRKLHDSGRITEGKELGLISEKNYDKYSNRVVYPIYDIQGMIIGLAGRSLTDNKKYAKWINPNVNETNLLYNKSKVWYGMDKARHSIVKKDEAWIMEGYNDVIGWHINGMQNTIASCGTAIASQQITELKRLCSKVVFCFDPDPAGIKSMIKYIPEFLKNGFRTEVCLLPCDPDDFTRLYSDSINKYLLPEMLKEPEVLKDGFEFLMDNLLVGSQIRITDGTKELCDLIANINDVSLVEIYSGWLAQKSKVKITTIKNWIKEAAANNIEVIDEDDDFIQIELPKEVKVPLSELEKDIRKYGMFMANNQIYMSLSDPGARIIHFSKKSNFMIEILQHMQDEKFPMKLLRIANVHGEEKIFDTQSENLNTPQAFDNTVTGHGNFRFDGNRSDLLRLRTYLFDKMGNGRKIDVLGWQPDGKFWAWNNKITTEDGNDIPLDKHGIFVKDNVYYYIPSANEIYKNNTFKFDAQKRFKVLKNPTSFYNFNTKVIQVHRDHGISAILFGIASLFQDIVVSKIDKFPILFFYGPGSTGKDELAEIVQSFVGIPQTAINLEGQVSTIKAQVREFAQFRNGISQLSEYKRGNSQLNGMLKALWDRRGYKRGNIESHVGTDSIPIESSAILTGNDYPDEEPLILRLVWNEMTKNQFTEEEMRNFDELKDMTAHGLSGYSDEIFKHRKLFEEKFEKIQRSWKGILQERFPEAKSRMIFNISILCAVYDIFKDFNYFPFSQPEMLKHFEKGFDQQIRKINAASVLNKFWQLFIASLRGHKEERIQVKNIVNVEGNLLFFNWTHCFSKIQRSWWGQFQEAAPAKSSVLEQIEKSEFYVESKKSYSFDSGREANRTSAIVINLDQMSEVLKNDIVGSIMFQLNQVDNENGQTSIFGVAPLQPPENYNGIKVETEGPF